MSGFFDLPPRCPQCGEEMLLNDDESEWHCPECGIAVKDEETE